MLNPDFRDMLSAFSDEGVEFLLVGAYALAVHGLPRATGHLDLWIRRSDENAARVLRALSAFGAPTDRRSVSDLASADLVFQIGVTPVRIDILTSIDAVEFDQAWPNRITTSIEGLEIPVISRVDLIRNKKATGRLQDAADVESLERQDG
ncbi:MAG TPA: hypothetical protein VFQ38_15365 [Longimicrobiales bacterium]|nr:hypothetical protein [Longimicrobiales bacterium]